MIEPFSSAYYIGTFTVEEYTGEEVALPYDLFEIISHQVYETPVPIPLMLRINGVHSAAIGESGIPPNTVAIPTEYIDTFDVNPPETTSILVSRKGRAKQISSWILEDIDNGAI